MKAKHDFDFIYDTQATFRILLNVLSNPLRIEDMSKLFHKFKSNGEWLSLATTLLDAEVKYYADLPENLKNEIQFLTGCECGKPEQADFVFVDKAKPEDILPCVKQGTLINPHLSALLMIKSEEESSENMIFNGPGIPAEGRIAVLSKKEKEWILKRDAMQYEYPCGIDMIFVRKNGSIFAVTRKAGADEWHM